MSQLSEFGARWAPLRMGLAVTMTLVIGLAANQFVEGQYVKPQDVRFRAESNSGNVRLEVYKTAPLAEILRSACKLANVTCSGVELLSQDSVPPMIVDGKFVQVVRQLVDGTQVNFEYTHGTAQLRPSLTFLRRTSVGHAAGEAVSTPSNDLAAVEPESAAVGSTGTASDRVASPESAVPTIASVPKTPVATSEQTDWRKAAEMIYAAGYASAATPSEFLPFPGPDGQPIPAKPVSAEYLPFPDQFGRPIPVAPAKPGSPFPPATETQAHN